MASQELQRNEGGVDLEGEDIHGKTKQCFRKLIL